METTPCKGHGGDCKNNAQFDGLCWFCYTARVNPFVMLQRWLDICGAIIADPPAGLSPSEFGYLERDTKELLGRWRP